MTPDHGESQPDSTCPITADWQAAEKELLTRVKDIAQRITARVRKAMRDTEPHAALPSDSTQEAPPVQ